MNFAHVKLYFTYKLTNLITHNKTNKLMLETDYSEVREPLFSDDGSFSDSFADSIKGKPPLQWSGMRIRISAGKE